jgi:hypothetical protein
MEKIVATPFHEIDGYTIYIYKRVANHDNKYVKVYKGKQNWKYILEGKKKGWVLGKSPNKKNIEKWIVANKDFILSKIKELDNA